MKKNLNKETIKKLATKIGLFSLLTLVLSSCVMVYNTTDLRRNIDKTVNQANDSYNDANRDYQEKNKIYTDLKENTIDQSLNPLNSISQEQKKLESSIKNLQHQRNKLVGNKNAFEKLVKNKDQIKSNEPEWKPFKTIKSNITNIVTEFTNTGKSYTAKSNNISTLFNSSKLSKLDPVEFDKQLQGNLSNLNGALLEVNAKMKKAVNDVEKIYSMNGMPDSVYTSKKEILLEMEEISKKVEHKSITINNLNKQFKIKTLGKKTVWVGQNTKANELVEKIKKNGAEINLLRNQFVVLSNKLNTP
ncbi:MAG: hypothetical protein P8I93_06425 [Crocinitomicaceae bacterium]|nr:hypothetical protein [Crocinitomicaceae bacterium]